MNLAIALSSIAVLLLLTGAGCKSNNTMPPPPASVINNTRDRLNPFRFTLTTDPNSPTTNSRVLLRVHVIDAADQPADGVDVQAEFSMSGMSSGVQQLTLNGSGNGDYEGEVTPQMAGSWDLDLTATRDGKSKKQRFNIDVGG